LDRLEQLRAQADEIRRIAARHKAHSAAVFGSVARGEDGPDSDIDLADFLKVSVDVIERDGLKPRDSYIRAEAWAL